MNRYYIKYMPSDFYHYEYVRDNDGNILEFENQEKAHKWIDEHKIKYAITISFEMLFDYIKDLEFQLKTEENKHYNFRLEALNAFRNLEEAFFPQRKSK